MTFSNSRLLLIFATAALLTGCTGASTGGGSIFSIPTDSPPAYNPPVSESYVIQRAPGIGQPSFAPYYDPSPVQGTSYDLRAQSDVLEVIAAENAQREAEARRLVLADLVARAEASTLPLNEGGYAPFEVTPSPAATFDAMADAEARAAAAEAEAAALSLELAEARAAVAEAEAAARAAEGEAQRAVRERVAQLAAERRRSRPVGAPPTTPPASGIPRDRANPRMPARSVLGRFATRPPTAGASQPATPPSTRQVAALTPPAARRPAPPRPIVERAPIPGLKPYILARSALPSAKPRRAPPTRAFGIGPAATLGAPGAASVTPPDITIPREPGADLSAQFFPTPGKPSTLGTDRDTSLDLVSIDATPYGVGEQVAVAVEGDSADWADAVGLIENGEVEALAITEDSDLVLTLCSGRSILTTPPDLASAATLTAPQIICGQNKPLELR